MASRRESPDEGPSSERSESPFGPGEKMNYKSKAPRKKIAAKRREPAAKRSDEDADAARIVEGDPRRQVVRIPSEGPIVYVSYAYADAPDVEEFVNTLRENGIRAQCDSLGFIDDRRDRAATRYRDAINRSEHVYLYATPIYFERASATTQTGVRMDIEMLSDWVLLDPHRHQRTILLRMGNDAVVGSPLPLLPTTEAIFRSPAEAAEDLARNRTPLPSRRLLDLVESRTELVDWVISTVDLRAKQKIPRSPRAATAELVRSFIGIGENPKFSHSSPSWVMSLLNDEGRARVSQKFIQSAADSARSSQVFRSASDTLLDPDTASLLAWATLLSRKSTTAENLWGTHLLAAILHRRAPWTEAAETALRELGLDPDELRDRLAEEITSWETGIPDEYLLLFNRDPSLPPLLLGQPLTRTGSRGSDIGTTWSTARGIARVAADDPSEAANLDDKVDHLKIDPDVIAFARVAASWDLTPPLAIGLFGDWGSGKTFFMKRMKSRIEKFSKEARDDKRPQKDLEYCKYVVQIEFNAWHYSEGDLWASLVDHIFTNLRLSDAESDSEVARRVKTMLTEMDSLRAKGEASAARAENLKKATDEASRELAAAQSRLLAAQSEFTAASVRDIWDIVRRDQKLQHQIKQLLVSAGVNDKNIKNAADLKATVEDAQALGGRVKQIARYLYSQRTNPWAYAAFVVTFGVPAALVALASALEHPAAQVGTLITGVLSALAGGIPIYRTIAGRVSEVVDLLDKPRRMAEEARRIELDAIQTRIQDLTEQRLEAEQHKKDVESQKKDLQKRIDAVNASRLLTEFLQDRAGTDDYRKRLGTLALIRRDFERLSNLMTAQRKEAVEGKAHATDPDDKYRVNRIVLYIDDLDRCAPTKVVEVLQAIHLLLAFPLFVVVVGVDARWVQRSIKQRYNELLQSSDAASREQAQEELGIASPRDYLEKIFQVPFWLPPLGIGGCHALMDGILRTDVAAAAGSAPQPNTQTAQARSQTPSAPSDANSGGATQSPSTATGSAGDATSAAGASNVGVSTATDPSAAGAPVPVTGNSGSGIGATGQAQTNPANIPPTDVAPQVTSSPVGITGDEAVRMKRFAPIVGTSPRSVKRFINCYRLFKSVVPGDRATPEPTETETNLSMFFLAVVVGAPDLFTIIHETILGFNDTSPSIASVRDALIERMDAAAERARERQEIANEETPLTNRPPTKKPARGIAAPRARVDNTSAGALAQWRRVRPILDTLSEEESATSLRNTAWIIERARRFGYDTAMGPTPPTPAPDPDDSPTRPPTRAPSRAHAADAPA